MNTEKGLAPIAIILIIVGLLAASGIGAVYYFGARKTPPATVITLTSPTSAPSITPPTAPPPAAENDTSDWQTYRNEEIGIEFKYPVILGVPDTLLSDNTKKEPKEIYSGKKIEVYFKKRGEYGWINFVAYSSNYKGWKDLLIFKGNDNIDSECPESFKYNEQGEACKIISVANENAIWNNFFIEDECSFGFGSRIYFNNKSPSIYKGIRFSLFYEDAEEAIDRFYDCTDNESIEKSYSSAIAQSKNIMEEKNLTENDQSRIKIFNQILSTFKFIK